MVEVNPLAPPEWDWFALDRIPSHGRELSIVWDRTGEHFKRGADAPVVLGQDPSLVVYDALGGAVGQTIGYIEGREAAQPFDSPPPLDAINAALVDEIFFNPSDP